MERSLKLITEEQKQQAFERALIGFRAENEILVRITGNHYQDALNILSSSFITDEPICKSAGATLDPAIVETWTNALQHNMSLMILNKGNNDIMGIFTLKIQTRDDELSLDAFTDPGLKSVMKFGEFVETFGSVYEHFNVSESFHLLDLAVVEKYRGRGIGTRLTEAALAMIKGFRFRHSVCVKVEGSSIYSKRIFEKIGFTTLFEIPFDEYTEDGKEILQNTGVNKSMKIYGMLLFPSLS